MRAPFWTSRKTTLVYIVKTTAVPNLRYQQHVKVEVAGAAEFPFQAHGDVLRLQVLVGYLGQQL